MNPFSTAFLKAPKRSRFDFSHSNTVGLQFGALTPTLSQFIVPGDEVSMSAEQIVRLAPMPVPTFVPMKVRHDFFFVPLRLLYGQEYLDKLFGSQTTTLARANLPNLAALQDVFSAFSWNYSSGYFEPLLASNSAPYVPGTLFDYLGYPVPNDTLLGNAACQALAEGNLTAYMNAVTSVPLTGNEIYGGSVNSPAVNIEKIFAYHFIWRDWYRFTGIQDNTIVEPYLSNGVLSAWTTDIADFGRGGTALDDYDPRFLPYLNQSTPSQLLFGDLSRLKLAHLSKDMFTSVRYGNKPTVLIPTGTAGTIPALREASAIQRFLDIISITGQRYFDKVKGLFGVEPDGPKDDRVQFLARYQQFIKVGEVLTTATTELSATGDYAGRGILIDGKYLFKRRFTEHGWLFCITSVIPEIAYNGLHRELTDIYPIDTPLPSLAEVGDQTVFRREMDYVFDISGRQNLSLGDQFRYYAYKSANNEVHGFFKLSTAAAWSPIFKDTLANIIEGTKVKPALWNKVFNATDAPYLYGDRFFMNIQFTEYITRALPKYINYHL